MSEFRRPFFPPEAFAHIDASAARLMEALPEPREGHISPDQAEFLYQLIRLTQPRFVVETGFGVGHSAIIIMRAQESVGIRHDCVSVDLCCYPENRTAGEMLAAEFPDFRLVVGDSKEVLWDAIHCHLRENEGLQLGLGVVDGGHDAETALRDLETMAAFLTVGGYLWLDDYGKIVPCGGANAAGRNFAQKWGHCISFRTADTRGFMLHQKPF